MARQIKKEMKYAYNPFKEVDNSALLMANLNYIDAKSIRCKFKATQDPINLAFDTIENTPLTILAKDFVKESFNDIVSFISKVCK